MTDQPQPTTSEDLKHWTVDKRIPLALLLAVGVQTVAVVIWGTTLTTDVRTMKDEQAKSDIRVQKIEDAAQNLNLIQYRLDQIDDRTKSIEGKVDSAIAK